MRFAQALATFAVRAAVKMRRQQGAASAVYVYIATDRFQKEHQYHGAVAVPLDAPISSTGRILRAVTAGFRQIYRPGYWLQKSGRHALGHQTDEHDGRSRLSFRAQPRSAGRGPIDGNDRPTQPAARTRHDPFRQRVRGTRETFRRRSRRSKRGRFSIRENRRRMAIILCVSLPLLHDPLDRPANRAGPIENDCWEGGSHGLWRLHIPG